jgi:hypothetical protein
LRDKINDLSRTLRRRITALEAATRSAPRGPRQPPVEVDPFLDQIAQGMGKKRFASLSPTHQDAVRIIAEKLRAEKPD